MRGGALEALDARSPRTGPVVREPANLCRLQGMVRRECCRLLLPWLEPVVPLSDLLAGLLLIECRV